MSDRGRSRRTARSTKATAPKAAPTPPGDEATADEVTPEEQPAAVTDVSSTSDISETSDGADVETVAEPSADADDAAETAAEDTDDDDADAVAKTPLKVNPPIKVTVARKAAVKKPADDEDLDADLDAESDADADAEATDDGDGKKKSSKDRGKTAAPLTKAEIRAAARIAAAKAARRRRVGQAIAGTLILVIAVGGAFAGIWYFGDRAEKNRVKCKPLNAAAFPPLLGGMDKKLGTEPAITAGELKNPKDELKKVKVDVLVKGDCKTVKPGQTIIANYVGATYIDGKVFDSSWGRKDTIEVVVGQKKIGQQPQVLEGWDDSLHGLKVGTRVQLDIPADKAYGEQPQQAGAPAGALRFIVDILDVKDTEPAGQVPFG